MNAAELTVRGIKCDAVGCDYLEPDVTFEQFPAYLNRACPQCGAPLLTEKDLALVFTMRSFVNWLSLMSGPQPDHAQCEVVRIERSLLSDARKAIGEFYVHGRIGRLPSDMLHRHDDLLDRIDAALASANLHPVQWVLGDPGDRRALAIHECYGDALPKQPMWKVKEAAYLDGLVLAKDGEWEYEPLPSNRDESYYARCRFDTFEQAVAAAEQKDRERRRNEVIR